MYDIKNYDSYSGSQVWKCYDSGNVFFKFTIKAGASSATFESSKFSMVVTSLHGTDEDLSICATSSLYDENKNYLKNVSMTLQPNEIRTFYISYYYPFCYRNGVFDEIYEKEVTKRSTVLVQYLYSGNQRLNLGGLDIKIIG